MDINIEVQEPQETEPIEISVSTGASYPILDDKPQINGITLLGNKTSEELGLQPKGDYLLRGEINIDGSISGDGFATKEELNKKANKSELSTVAFSGSYNDLKNKPTIPSVPTKTSQLTNDSGFITQHQNISHLATKTELNNKQDKLVAGSNISIVNNVISAIGVSGGEVTVDAYTKTETDNLLSGKQDKGDYALKSDISGKQDKLIAGENITIEGNVISSIGSSSDSANVDLSNLSDTGKAVMDGQWVDCYVAIASNASMSTQNVTYDLSEHLPIDNYNYEVIFNGAANVPATKGSYCNLYLRSDVITTNVGVCGINAVSAVQDNSKGSAIVPIGVNRYVVVGMNSNSSGTYSLNMVAYKRLGTNS